MKLRELRGLWYEGDNEIIGAICSGDCVGTRHYRLNHRLVPVCGPLNPRRKMRWSFAWGWGIKPRSDLKSTKFPAGGNAIAKMDASPPRHLTPVETACYIRMVLRVSLVLLER